MRQVRQFVGSGSTYLILTPRYTRKRWQNPEGFISASSLFLCERLEVSLDPSQSSSRENEVPQVLTT